jgi:phenylacetate-CoA ligase
MNRLTYDFGVPTAAALALDARRTERDPDRLARAQQRRFARLLRHAQHRSPFYRQLYAGAASPALRDLQAIPPVTKQQVMEHFDEVVTDRSISQRAVLDHFEDPQNLGHAFQGRYFIARTSGTTGLVGHYVHDLFSYFLCQVLTAARSPATRHPAPGRRWAGPRRVRAASVLSPVANLGVASVIASSPRFARWLADLQLFDIFAPWDQTVAALNEFRPDVLGSFPTVLEQLAQARQDGRLRIRPQAITSGGEILTPRTRRAISDAFGCPVFDCYGSAECGWLGMECRQQDGIHLFVDWLMVEAVDQDGRPVPPGRESDKILVTNLANRVQPFIRFEITDRVTLLEGACPCGSVLPRVLVRGRASEVLYLPGEGGRTVQVPPFHLTTLAEMVPGIHRYQVVQERDDELLVLFTARPEADSDGVQARLQSSFEDYLRRHELRGRVHLTVQRSEAIRRDRSGKVRQVLPKAESPA